MAFLRFGSIGAALAGMLLAVGCQSTGTGAGSASSAGPGVTCGKCMTTWVKSPVTEKGRVVAYRNRKAKTTCPDCEKAAAEYMATGKLGDCEMCGDDLSVSAPQKM